MMIDLDDFFHTKISPRCFHVLHDNKVHEVYTDEIVQALHNMDVNKRCKIAGTLFALDFENKSLEPFLYEVAKEVIASKA